MCSLSAFFLPFLQHINVQVHENVLHFRGETIFLNFLHIWCKTLSVTSFFYISCIAQGHGAKGQNEYEFGLEFLFPVKPEVHISSFTSSFLRPVSVFLTMVIDINLCTQVRNKSTQRQVNITVRKQQRGWWERLTVQERKPVFLAPDFDRWLDESDAEMEIQQKVRFKKSFFS